MRWPKQFTQQLKYNFAQETIKFKEFCKVIWYLTIISSFCFSFLVPPEAYPGRISLLLITFLAMINIFMSIMESTPISGQINKIQLWLLSCIGFVFWTVIEYAIILCLMRFAPKSSLLKMKSKGNILDNVSLLIIPFAFIIYMFAYFADL